MRYYIGPEGKLNYLLNPCGLPVIIDVLRASSTIIVALYSGAARIIPVVDADEALALGKSTDAILIGERHGIRLDGFDYGNSPGEMLHAPIRGKTIVITTTNGTRVMIEGGIVASTLNAGPVAEKISSTPHSYLLASGAPLKSEEDLSTAKLIELIANRIREGVATERAVNSVVSDIDGSAMLDDIRHSASGKKLAASGYSEDVEMICSQINRFPVIPRYHNGEITL